ncbi:MAG: hypothetical protein GTN36_00190 [Candidatus Aenigmarchaeota archaeon]|nr:hypothetical protein [Candidatus Aenigmarchaeota archaeon]
MTDVVLGFLTALIAAMGWGTYLVPMKKIKKLNPFQFQLLMCNGIFLFSLLISITLNYSLSLNLFGIVSGLIWSTGNIISILAVKKIGLGRASAIWMSFVILVSFLWGILFFQENLNSVYFGVFGVFLIMVGILFVSLSRSKGRYKISGIMVAILAGLLFGSQYVPLKISNLTPDQFLFSMSFGILIAGWIYSGWTLFFSKNLDISNYAKKGFLSGIFWVIANLSALFAVANLGISIGFPLTQLSLLIAVLWGIFYFKEVMEKKHKMKVLIGAIVMLLGAFLLAFAR